MKTVSLKQLLLLGVLAGANGAWAEAPDPGWGMGVTGFYQGQPDRAVDADWLILPLLRRQGGLQRLPGPELLHRVLEPRRVRLDLIAKMRFDGLHAQDSPFLQGMAERNLSLDLGVRAGVYWKGSVIEGLAWHERRSSHQGSELALNWRLPQHAAGWNIVPEIGVSRLSTDLANSYYGVRSPATRPGYFADRGGATYSAYVALVLQRPLGPHWSTFLRAEVSQLEGGLRASPIGDRRTMSSVLVGIDLAFDGD